jgi:hypothetical protein
MRYSFEITDKIESCNDCPMVDRTWCDCQIADHMEIGQIRCDFEKLPERCPLKEEEK